VVFNHIGGPEAIARGRETPAAGKDMSDKNDAKDTPERKRE